MSEPQTQDSLDPNELSEGLRVLRARFEELRGRL